MAWRLGGGAAPPKVGQTSDPLWADGAFALRIQNLGTGSERVVETPRPYALLGRLEGADIRIEDRAVSARHVYLHLDRRGLFGVDLATRTGTRFSTSSHAVGWLRAGDWLEVAGRRIEVVWLRLDGAPLEPPPCATDLLAEAGSTPLVAVTLHRRHVTEPPRALGSELVFLGRTPSCAVQVEGASASRVHCVLVRTPAAAYVVDLIGQGTWLNDHPLRGASVLKDGDCLTVGLAQFTVRVEGAAAWPAHPSGPGLTGPATRTLAAGPPPLESLPARISEAASELAALEGSGALAGSIVESLPPGGPQEALLAWMMGAIQAGQNEAMRRQSEFQLAITRLVHQLHLDNAALMAKHLERMESINREIGALRDEIRQRFAQLDESSRHGRAGNGVLDPKAVAGALGRPGPAASGGSAAVPPPEPADPARPRPPTGDADAATSWLLQRVHQLEEENRRTWRDLLGSLTGMPRRSP